MITLKAFLLWGFYIAIFAVLSEIADLNITAMIAGAALYTAVRNQIELLPRNLKEDE